MSRELHPQAKDVLTELGDKGLPPKRALEPEAARRDLEALLADRGDPVPLGQVLNTAIPGPDGGLSVRIYRPKADRALPVLVYFHGGAWIRGNLETHDPVCRRIAARANCLVIAVDYRLAPEHQFPAQIEDSYAAVEWATTYAETIGGDPESVAVGGDSAGGNLAAAVSLLARDRDGPALVHQLLLYPTLNYHEDLPSYGENEEYFGTRIGRDWTWEMYLGSDVHSRNAYAVPFEATEPDGVPSATVLTAEFDMLRDEGQIYAARLGDAGVDVTELVYDDVFHAFLNFPGLATADEAFDDIANALDAALE
jgi:acetyl esterase